MIKAIVYTSNSGYTAKYAQLLSQEINAPCYTLKDAKDHLAAGDEIVYMGWLMAGIIKGKKKAVSKYNAKVICAVGMSPVSDKECARLAEQNNISGDGFFMLQGGFDINKLHGIYKAMMKLMCKKIVADSEKPCDDPEKAALLAQMREMALNGKDCTSTEALAPLVAYLTK